MHNKRKQGEVGRKEGEKAKKEEEEEGEKKDKPSHSRCIKTSRFSIFSMILLSSCSFFRFAKVHKLLILRISEKEKFPSVISLQLPEFLKF